MQHLGGQLMAHMGSAPAAQPEAEQPERRGQHQQQRKTPAGVRQVGHGQGARRRRQQAEERQRSGKGKHLHQGGDPTQPQAQPNHPSG